MSVDRKIIEEINRYKSINRYIMEQDVPPPPAGDAELPPPPGDPMEAGAPPADPMAAGAPPADPMAAGAPPAGATPPPAPVDTATDPDVEKVEDKQEEYFNNLFKSLQDLEEKLSNMDTIVNKLNDLEAKVEKYRVKSPEEKMELRSLDSGPFNQKLSQYFEDKQDDFEKQGREEYILTKDEVEDFSPSEVKKSFRNFENGEDNEPNAFNQFKY